ncbi:anthranilate synthase component I family protein, partial [Magnetococcales bacterium HHB-1]
MKLDFSQFQQLAQQGNVVPLYAEIFADLDTPVSAFLKVAGNTPYAFLLESVHGGEKWGRFSLIGMNPDRLFSVQGQNVSIIKPGESIPEETIFDCNPMTVLKNYMQRFKPVEIPELPRFHGGLVGFFSYDMVRCFEKIPNENPDRLNTPDALFMRADTVLIFDNLLGKMKIVVNVHIPEESKDLKALYVQAEEKILKVKAQLKMPLPDVGKPVRGQAVEEDDFSSEIPRDHFEEAVRRAKEYIAAGDIMQVVLSQRLSIPFSQSSSHLYRALRTLNPSPYMFLLRLGDFSLVGSSPEILVRQEEETITVRPIAGTRPRGLTEQEDLALEKELLADPKECAEHIMLVDLGRNDIGRIAEVGSVKVTDKMVIERYSHVMHIVSNVEGRLKKDLDAFDVIAATFPAGTVSGAPKIRAMEIIDEL